MPPIRRIQPRTRPQWLRRWPISVQTRWIRNNRPRTPIPSTTPWYRRPAYTRAGPTILTFSGGKTTRFPVRRQSTRRSQLRLLSARLRAGRNSEREKAQQQQLANKTFSERVLKRMGEEITAKNKIRLQNRETWRIANIEALKKGYRWKNGDGRFPGKWENSKGECLYFNQV